MIYTVETNRAPETIKMIVNGDTSTIDAKYVVAEEGEFKLLEVPRYGEFKEFIGQLGRGVQIIEIVGNEKIQARLKLRDGDTIPPFVEELYGFSTLEEDDSKFLIVEVDSTDLNFVDADKVDHLYDY